MNPLTPSNDCEIAAGLLPDHWKNQLDAPERAAERLWLHRHLEACGDCAGLAGFWARMEAPAPAAPGAREAALARQRFEQMLAGYTAALADAGRAASRPPVRRNWFTAFALRPLPAMAAALLLVAGAAAGWVLHRPAASADGNQEIAELRDQVQSTRQLAVLSLLQQQQANDRLQGVMYSTRLPQDPQVTSALLHSLNYDSSPDVRLAAVDALSQQAGANGTSVREGLLGAFQHQTSPLVQVALIDSFVALRDRSARGLLEQVSKDSAITPQVRQRAVWALAQPAWN